MSEKLPQVHLGVFFQGVGHTIGWRHPDHVAHNAFSTYVEFAQLAERGKFDLIFFGEGLVVREHQNKFFGSIVNGRPDSLALIPALAAVTSHIGMVATVSSTYNQPYELARQFASIDHVTDGRVGWNVVTTFSNSAAKDSGGDQVAYNFSKSHHLDHATRYDRAREFVALIKRLWDSWQDDAFDNGTLDHTRIHPVEHQDTWFSVNGALDVPRSPQGHPVIVQAGQSPDGRDLAARITDVIFSPSRDIDESKAYYDDVKSRMLGHGRDPQYLRMLPGLSVVIGATEEEAKAKAAHYRELLYTTQIVRYLLSEQSGADFTDVDLDGPFPVIDTTASDINGALVTRWSEQASANNLTVRQLALHVFANWTVVGTPIQVADYIEKWVRAEACDGFLLTPTVLPNDLRDFVDLVVPELQRRGLYRTDYSGRTLRDHLDIPRPASVYETTSATLQIGSAS